MDTASSFRTVKQWAQYSYKQSSHSVNKISTKADFHLGRKWVATGRNWSQRSREAMNWKETQYKLKGFWGRSSIQSNIKNTVLLTHE